MDKLTEKLEKDAERIERAEELKQASQATEVEAYDGYTGEKVKLIPSPNYSDAKPVGSMLPINMANETVSNLDKLSRQFDFVDFIKEKLKYNSRVKVVQSFASEQIDALVLAITQFEAGAAFIIGDSAGIGKGRSQPLDAKIMTPTGWKAMGEMRVGSKVFTQDGTVTKVIGVYPQGKIDVYEVVFSDGSKTQCSKDHLWNVLTDYNRNVKLDGYKTKTLGEIIKGGIKKRYSIPLVDAVQIPYKETPIDPYLLGVLLGDACIREHGVELTCADDEILQAVNTLVSKDGLKAKKYRDIHYQISRDKVKSSGKSVIQYSLDGVELNRFKSASDAAKTNKNWKTHSIRGIARGDGKTLYGYKWKYGDEDGRNNKLIEALRLLNLTGKTAINKFIPEIYKINSSEVRLAMLQGLMDTDGYIDASGNASYTTISKQLADDVKFLVMSLGGVSRIVKKKTTHNDAYTIWVKLPNGMIPFRMTRKVVRCKKREKYPPMRMIRSITLVGQKECQCIKVAHESSLYVTDDFIVTHNTCAGVLRYAYVNGFIPVFFSQKPYLFNDIYRDILDIDGMGVNEKGFPVTFKPLVMHAEGVVVGRDGKPIPTAQDIRESNKDGAAIYRFVDKRKEGSIDEICKSITEKINKTGKIALPKEFNAVLLPYSVMSQSRSQVRRSFLTAIAPNAILVFDESHNAASANLNSNVLKTGLPLVEAAKAVLFSSATYAKTPNVFNLYIVKTALRTAVPSLESITDALKVGGENVSEYIASGLVKEGQMIRRTRSFGDCKKVTEYVGDIRREDIEGTSTYTPVENDMQRAFYDEAIGYFKEMRDYSKSELAYNAIKKAIERKMAEEGIEMADMKEYKDALDASKEDAPNERRRFIANNKNKYIIKFNQDSISRYKATFRENLFLAVKAKFTADKIIESLNTPVDYTNVDGSKHAAPLKPLIAIANTGEAIFNELRLKKGDKVKNDFSVYLRAIYNRLFIGTFTARKVDANIFTSTTSLVASGDEYEQVELEYHVLNEDFSDGGTRIEAIQSSLNNYVSELPFSTIDYLRERIQSVQRADVYYTNNSKAYAKYGDADSSNYKFAEATSRKFMLVDLKDGSGEWVYTENNRIKSTTEVFRAFNNGAVDVMLINVVASTGGSAQSSPKEGKDVRPRNMFIIQFELDINVEVQKRGRVSRTGQINSPVYTYIISKIPVELRKYLMLRKKLRKLDANTSADQTASSKSAELTDREGNVIEDIFNAYGFEVFSQDFITQPDNMEYANIFNDMFFRGKAIADGEDAEVDEAHVEQFNAFIRELELYPAVFQENFFDQMNEKYIAKKEQLLATGNFQEELEAQNYRASLRQRVVVQLNSGSTVFSMPLFLADYYTLENKKPFSKDKVEQKMAELAVWNGVNVTPEQFYLNLLADYMAESAISKEALREELAANPPKREDFETDDSFEVAELRFTARNSQRMLAHKLRTDRMMDMLRFYKPGTPVIIDGNLGKMVGYKIKATGTRYKYTDGNVDFIFCCLSQYPIIHYKMTNLAVKISSAEKEDMTAAEKAEVKTILGNIKDITQFLMSDDSRRRIEMWQPDLNKRTIRRFYSGNILSGIIEAAKEKEKDTYSALQVRNWALTRFTNMDGSTSTAIELKYDKELPRNTQIATTAQTLSVAADNVNMFAYINDMGTSWSDKKGEAFPIWNIESDKIWDRSICIMKRSKYGALGGSGVTTYIDFEIMQTYIMTEDRDTKAKKEKARKPGEKYYNNLYYDNTFFDKFKDHSQGIMRNEKVAYAIRQTPTKYGTFKEEFTKFQCYMKRLRFNIQDEAGIKEVLRELYRRYEVSFNFRADTAEYYNTERQADVFDAENAENEVQAYPAGEYAYRYIRKQTIENAVPNLIRTTLDGVYGGVILSQPISPASLPAFELKPYKIPNNVLVNLALSVLGEDKGLFIRELRAEANSKDAFEVGEFVRRFLVQRSVGITYFFGDLRTPEYGQIFKEYALGRDVEQLEFDAVEEEMEPVKSTINFDDAERFVIKLWSLV